MTSPIQQNNAALSLPSSRPAATQKQYGSYQEALSQRSASDITLTTAEGDVVRLTNAQALAFSRSAEMWSSPLRQGMNFTASALNSSSFQLAVDGDLNEEELADIQSLLADLSTIAGSFFSGDLDKAMEGALSIGDMGSIATLSATFSYSAKWNASAQLTDYHPLPASGDPDSLTELFAKLPDIIDQATTDDMKYAQMLQAQWQQIQEFLDAIQAHEIPPPDATTSHLDQSLPAARQMMNRIEQTMAKHPRLAPFSLPLAHEAIDQQTANLQHPAVFDRKNSLKDHFLQELNQWMYSV